MRLPDWEARLSALVRDRRGEPFRWGRHDCVLWSADAVLAMTGTDHALPYRGRYSTLRGAVRVLRSIGSSELPVTLADAHLGRRLPIAMARTGDVVVADLEALGLSDGSPLGPALGVCMGRRSLFVGTEGSRDGLIALDTLSLGHCHHV